MKKTYERPVLTTEQFDKDDVITVSSPGGGQSAGLGTTTTGWQVDTPVPPDVIIN